MTNKIGEKIFGLNICYVCEGSPALGAGTLFVAGYCQKCQRDSFFAVDPGKRTDTLKVGQLDGELFVEATKNPENMSTFTDTLPLSKGGYPQTPENPPADEINYELVLEDLEKKKLMLQFECQENLKKLNASIDGIKAMLAEQAKRAKRRVR
ncbi:MAG TPA: hypothetical protein PLJ37_00695 [Chitinophagales bacterium]|nr:hypothetical protein [Chitinophagales bacterium]HMW93469.1 hypothetical protein [Chitinophagales bacterium]HMZ92908.1 hypothetical protein [Chitinophagales bacterium]HNG25903.1 hypothetical protein [Chitinophagales bacterium]